VSVKKLPRSGVPHFCKSPDVVSAALTVRASLRVVRLSVMSSPTKRVSESVKRERERARGGREREFIRDKTPHRRVQGGSHYHRISIQDS